MFFVNKLAGGETKIPLQQEIIVEVQLKEIIPIVNEDIMYSIMMCESGGNPKAKNPTSSAKGLYQIIDGTWDSFQCTGDVLNGEDNTKCAQKIATE